MDGRAKTLWPATATRQDTESDEARGSRLSLLQRYYTHWREMGENERGASARQKSRAGSACCKAKRYAVKYNPATIVLEYETPTHEKRLRSVKVQGLDESSDVEMLTEKVIRSFPRNLDRKSVSVKQVQRLVEKLIQAADLSGNSVSKSKPEEASREPPITGRRPVRSSTESFGMSVDSIADAETDLNKLSVEELNDVKAAMDIRFKKNLITKENPEFQYDVQVDFNPDEDNDWDDSDEDD